MKGKETWEEKMHKRRSLTVKVLLAVLESSDASPGQKLEAVKILRDMGEL